MANEEKIKVELEIEEKFLNDILRVCPDYPENYDKKEALIHVLDKGFFYELENLAMDYGMGLDPDY